MASFFVAYALTAFASPPRGGDNVFVFSSSALNFRCWSRKTRLTTSVSGAAILADVFPAPPLAAAAYDRSRDARDTAREIDDIARSRVALTSVCPSRVMTRGILYTDSASRTGAPALPLARRESKMTTTVEGGSAEKRRRKSRWETTDDAEGNKTTRKSRWETSESTNIANVAADDENGGRALVPLANANDFAGAHVSEPAGAMNQTLPMTNALIIGSGIFVQLPTSVLTEHSAPSEATAEVHFLFAELGRLNRRLLAGGTFDDRPADSREPEPAPIYDANGVRVNTPDVVEREKFQYRRMAILEEICQKCPTFRPPPDYRPNKRTAKLLIPVDEYPGYNFFGLIIGPRGSTQKQMQRETNTRIVIRGRGSAKGGTGAAERNNEYDNEPLHVLIEGDVQSDVDKAKAMIQKLLIPIDEDMNEHKRQQLKELALMNGTWRDESSIEAMQKRLDEEVASGQVYQLPEPLKKAVEATYRKDVEKLHGSGAGGTLDTAYSDFLSELGVDGRGRARRLDENAEDDRKVYIGRLPTTATAEGLKDMFSSAGVVQEVACIPDTVLGHSCKGFAFITFATVDDAMKAASTMNGVMFEDRPMEVRMKNAPREQTQKEANEFDPNANLYVGGVTESMNEDALREIFSPYGLVQKTKIVRDHATQAAKGYGFVQMMDPSHAQAAITALDGQYFADSTRPFMVRIAGQNGGGGAQVSMAFPSATNFDFTAPGYGNYQTPVAGMPPFVPPMMMMDPSGYYGQMASAESYAAATYGAFPTVELGNPEEAPPPPPDDEDAPPPMPGVLPLVPDALPILPGVAPPAPPPLPP